MMELLSDITKHKLHILILEDVPADLELLEHEFKKNNFDYESECVSNRAKFLKALKDFKPDIVLSDYSLPDLNGMEALKLTKDFDQFLPFIIVTGSLTEEHAVDLMKAGADDYIIKDHLNRVVPAIFLSIKKKKLEKEKAQVEKALKESEELFRNLAASTSSAIFIYQGEKFVYANSATEKLTGYSSDELLSMNFWDIVHPAYQELIKQRGIARQRGEPIPNRYEFKIINKDGTEMWIDFAASKITWKGKPAAIGSAFDITDRKKVEIALKESEERYRLFFEEDLAANYLSTIDGKILDCNSSFLKLFGFKTKEEALSINAEILYNNKDNRKSYLEILKNNKILRDYEIELKKLDGTIIYAIENVVGIFNDKGELTNILGYIIDETERKTLLQQLLRSQRLESIGTLAGGIAHDLNNVLSPILLSIDFLKRRHHQDEPTLKMLESIEKSTLRGRDIIKQVLTFARGLEGKYDLLQPKHILSEIENIIIETFPKSINFKAEIANDLLMVIGDPTLLHQVILNICVNARDAMPSGGNLVLSAQNVILDEQYITMSSGVKSGKFIVISVSDTGVGIPPHIKNKIFEPFFSTKEIGKGTGLGLSTSNSIIKSHGGFITFESEEGKGTTFKIFIPAVESAEASTTDKVHLELPIGNGETILVIDDESSILDIIKQTLEAYGYSILTATDGAEAIAQFALKQKEIEIVLTDIMMPNLDGVTAVRAMRKMNPNVKVIFISGLKIGEPSVPNIDFKIDGFIQKPFTSEHLVRTVGDVLKEKKET